MFVHAPMHSVWCAILPVVARTSTFFYSIYLTCMSSSCYVRNPATGRMVLKKGQIGREIARNKKTQSIVSETGSEPESEGSQEQRSSEVDSEEAEWSEELSGENSEEEGSEENSEENSEEESLDSEDESSKKENSEESSEEENSEESSEEGSEEKSEYDSEATQNTEERSDSERIDNNDSAVNDDEKCITILGSIVTKEKKKKPNANVLNGCM